jgi:hypothetical protein
MWTKSGRDLLVFFKIKNKKTIRYGPTKIDQ